jgi:hypothetical protein
MPPSPPDPARDPNEQPDGVRGRLWERYRKFSAPFGGRFKLSIALGIVVVSILAALMAWQSSVWGERSGNTDELTRQDQVQLERILSSQNGAINQDIRVFNNFEQATLLAQELDKDAGKLSGQASLDLQLEAGAQRAEAKSQRRFFEASAPHVDDDGQVVYDAAFTERLLRANSPELEVLRPDELRADAREAGVKSVRLTGLAALFVAALLFLTLAEVSRRSIARIFAAAGVATSFAALLLFLFAI